jgi:hypothetical protein
MPCSVNNVQAELAHVPVRSRCIQVCPAIGSSGFVDFSEPNHAN